MSRTVGIPVTHGREDAKDHHLRIEQVGVIHYPCSQAQPHVAGSQRDAGRMAQCVRSPSP